ncbi:cobalamin-binding protein [Shewanella intestini]|uniref:Cobalamin-binding protein n=1 Tax=Shewanella intestini TaxID=2017544 RepID=A0ABS5I376_9GAMM|nr:MULTISPECIES: cobalamin-binding protein [Shewanella]MBR9728471.1 cobalamin-binding protein [Shewanella intestini]MRG36290.1 ABC transporter substrate-binding protein [Shewanella sp. XMDDZSB0408]
MGVLMSMPVAAKTPPTRIVALSPHAVEMLYAIGAGDNIVATTEYADYPEAAKNIPTIGGYHGIQIEKVIEYDPDLVVVWQAGNKLTDLNQLKALGYNIYNSSPKTLADVASDLRDLGKLTGHQQQAEKVAERYEQQLTSIKQVNLAKKPVKVFYQLWSTPLRTVAKGSWIQNIIDVCHGDNVFYEASNEYPIVSIENVLISGAQVILQSKDKGNILGVNWQEWPELPAVKQQHIYQLDADLLHRASPRAIAGVKLVCDALDKAR